MLKIILGLVALLAMATGVGYVSHWAIAVAFMGMPVAFVYVRLKLSTHYRATADQRLSAFTKES